MWSSRTRCPRWKTRALRRERPTPARGGSRGHGVAPPRGAPRLSHRAAFSTTGPRSLRSRMAARSSSWTRSRSDAAASRAARDIQRAARQPRERPRPRALARLAMPNVARRARPYASLLSVKVGSTEVAGTLVQGDPRIVFIDGFWSTCGGGSSPPHEASGQARSRRTVGTLLASPRDNLVDAGRTSSSAWQALMILTLDDAVPDEVRARISAFEDINAVRTARLGV